MMLIEQPYDEVCEKINYMMAHEEGIKNIFYTKRNRLLCSKVATIISDNNQDIGFINIVDQGLDNLLFVDQGIISKYRGRGYGSEALNILLDIYPFKEYLIYETKDNNQLANQSIKKIGKFIFSYNDSNFYLLQKERYNNFSESEELNQLENYATGNIIKTKRLTI